LKKSLKNQWQLGSSFKFLKKKTWVWEKIAYFNSFRCFYSNFFAFFFVFFFFWQNMNSLAQMCILHYLKNIIFECSYGLSDIFSFLMQFFWSLHVSIIYSNKYKDFQFFLFIRRINSPGSEQISMCPLKFAIHPVSPIITDFFKVTF
jgi:hypothetical protein